MIEFHNLSNNQNTKDLVYAISETILGIPKNELGEEFLQEFDRFIGTLEGYLIKNIKILLFTLNCRFSATIFVLRFKKFTDLPIEKREQYLAKWSLSRIALLRTAYVTLKALSGWSFYALEKSWPEFNYPGHTIGREHETPTLLYGKQPWVDLRGGAQ